MIPASDSTVLLRDGSAAEIRPYEPADGPLLADLLRRLSAETLRLRFHTGAPPANAKRLFASGSARRFVADVGGTLLGAACYIPLTEPGLAELAVVVSDADHGHGVGTRLVERVAEAARREGMHRLLALVLAENAAMLHLLDDLGFAVRRTVTGSEVEVMVELDADAAYLDARDARDHASAARSPSSSSTR
jgi:L-amino acid N-acyltransferase YncA